MKEKQLSRLVLLGLVAMGSPLLAQQTKPAQGGQAAQYSCDFWR